MNRIDIINIITNYKGNSVINNEEYNRCVSPKVQELLTQNAEDKEIMLTAINEYPGYFSYVAPSLKEDKNFIMAALDCEYKFIGKAIIQSDIADADAYNILNYYKTLARFIHPSLLSDKEFVLKMLPYNVGTYYPLIMFVDPALKRDKDVVTQAIKCNISSLGYIDDTFKKDMAFMKDIIAHNVAALYYAADTLRNDKEFVRPFLEQRDTRLKIEQSRLSYMGDTIKDDEELVKCALEQNTGALEWASPRLKCDKEFIKSCINDSSIDYSFMSYVDESIKKDKDFIIEMIPLKPEIIIPIIKYQSSEVCDLAFQLIDKKKKSNN